MTFLQDVVHWRHRYPEFFLWDNELFQTDAFRSFEVNALRMSREREVSIDQRVKDALPVLAEQLSGLLSQHEKSISALGQRVDEGLNSFNANLHAQSQMILTQLQAVKSLLSTPVPVTLPPITLPAAAPVIVQIPPFSISLDPSSSTSLLPPALEGDQTAAAGPVSSGLSTSTPGAAILSPAPIPEHPRISTPEQTFCMSRNVTSVQNLWTEYSVGLGGRSSVRFMYEQGGLPNWRAKHGDSERHFYGTRKTIWTFIQEIARKRGSSNDDIAARLDGYRVKKGFSLNALSKALRKKGEQLSVELAI